MKILFAGDVNYLSFGVTLANNHIGDFGEDAVKDTIRI